jgi:hypothetical protein
LPRSQTVPDGGGGVAKGEKEEEAAAAGCDALITCMVGMCGRRLAADAPSMSAASKICLLARPESIELDLMLEQRGGELVEIQKVMTKTRFGQSGLALHRHVGYDAGQLPNKSVYVIPFRKTCPPDLNMV